MTDREKLRDLIGRVQDEGVSYVDCFSDTDKPEHISNDELARYLISRGVRLETKQAIIDITSDSKWISVEDERPSGWVVIDADTDYREPETYIVFVKGATFPTTAYFLDGKFAPACDGYLSKGLCSCIGFADDITHWMPLPKPPREE